MTCVLPMRKIMSIIWKPALKKKKRTPSTLVYSMEVSKMKNVASRYRLWLSIVLGLALMYSLYVSMYKLPPQTREEGDNGDIEVIRYSSSKTACVYGCNMQEVSRKTNTSIADLVALANPAPPSSRGTVKLPKCRIQLNKDDDPEIRYEAYKPDFKYRKNIKAGGYNKPKGCEPWSKVAIIVPYRDRKDNLLVFLYNIHPFLVKQMLQYRIFVIEQSGHEKFNKGRLFNAGFDLAGRFGSWDCLVFHDVNLLPRYRDTSYACPVVPTQMCTSVVRFNKTYPQVLSSGGVMSMTPTHFRAVNGYSNLYWGSVGADASDMFWRLRAEHLRVQKYEKLKGRYTMLPDLTESNKTRLRAEHLRVQKYEKLKGRYTMLPDLTESNKTRHKRVSAGDMIKRYKTDGLANSNYKTISIKLRSLYTHIVVDINPNKDLTE